jgi:malate/lactate dehydrogenase
MSKVTVVGAGNVGATCANVLAFNEVADEVVMLDVKEGVSEGKAMDYHACRSRCSVGMLSYHRRVTSC